MHDTAADMGPLPSTVAGVILAGGRSSRMGGRDKALIPLAGRPLIAHAVARLSGQSARIAINSNAGAAPFAAYGLPVLPDDPPNHSGPLAGVLAGLDWAAAEGMGHIVTVAVDTPFFPADLVARLCQAAGPSGLSLSASAGSPGPWRHPTFGLWPVALRDDLRQALADGTRKMQLWADRHDPGVALFDAGDRDPFFNINTPADLDRANALMMSP